MKQSLYAILLAVFLLPCAAAAQTFPRGSERLDYSIRHNLFPGNVGKMTFQGSDSGGDYHVDATLHVSVAGIYSLDCLYTTTFRNDAALTPLRATRDHKEKKYTVKAFYDWSAPGKVHLDVTKSTRPHRDQTLSWSGTVRDLIGMIWWLRSLDYGGDLNRYTGDALLLDHDALPIRIASARKGTAKYKGQAVRTIDVSVVQGEKEALQLTLIDDALRTPLKFAITLSFGTIKGTLK
ncbi:MAG: DUF3108 domain-containing protein [Bacteroidales bacterium]|nr:DUF3108 domain-containing protein [Bacteroidales bacterium]